MDLGVAGVGAGGGSLLPQLGVWGGCKLPHCGPTPYSIPADKEINDICLISTFRRLRLCCLHSPAPFKGGLRKQQNRI